MKTLLSSDTTTNLPEPDTSDWTFKEAADRIRTHQDLCRTPSILAHIKSNTASPAVATQSAVTSNGGMTRTTTGSSGTPAGSTGKNVNPNTGAKRPASGSTITVTGAAAKLAQ